MLKKAKQAEREDWTNWSMKYVDTRGKICVFIFSALLFSSDWQLSLKMDQIFKKKKK